MVVKTLR